MRPVYKEVVHTNAWIGSGMPSSLRANLLKQVERAIAAAGDISSVLRQLEPAQEPTGTVRARFSAAVRNLIALRRQAPALGNKH